MPFSGIRQRGQLRQAKAWQGRNIGAALLRHLKPAKHGRGLGLRPHQQHEQTNPRGSHARIAGRNHPLAAFFHVGQLCPAMLKQGAGRIVPVHRDNIKPTKYGIKSYYQEFQPDRGDGPRRGTSADCVLEQGTRMRRDAQKKNGSLAAVAAALFLATVTAAHASVEISSAATSNMSCSAGVCSPTAKKAVLNVTDLANMLARGDVKITTGNGANNIVVKDGFSWTATSRLRLVAVQSVEFDKPVTVAGIGAATIIVNRGGRGGDLLFGDKGNLTFWDLGSSLTINRNSYTLVGDIKTLSADLAANPNGSYALVNDYDATLDGEYKGSPADSVGGVFEGLGHSIFGLAVLNPRGINRAGLFNQIDSKGTVRNLSISRSRVHGSIAGILAAVNFGTIVRCDTHGRVHGKGTEGGLVGLNVGMILESHSSALLHGGNKSGAAFAGGLVGENDGTILGSYATGHIYGIFAGAGGLVGEDFGLVSQSHATGKVTNLNQINDSTGGLVGGGGVGEKILRSYATGNVVGYTRAGGLIGLGQTIDQSFATGAVTAAFAGGLTGQDEFGFANISNSYSTGSTTGSFEAVGGFEGDATSIITSSYSIGSVSAPNGPVGGFIGEDGGGSRTNTYWDLDTSGISDPSQGAGNIPNDPGITGLTDVQLKAELPSGFDPTFWGQNASINNGYPYLIANPPPQ